MQRAFRLNQQSKIILAVLGAVLLVTLIWASVMSGDIATRGGWVKSLGDIPISPREQVRAFHEREKGYVLPEYIEQVGRWDPYYAQVFKAMKIVAEQNSLWAKAALVMVLEVAVGLALVVYQSQREAAPPAPKPDPQQAEPQ